MTVATNTSNQRDASMLLYLLRSGGSIELVDSVRENRWIGEPAFLRSERGGVIRMYWTRLSDALDPSRDAFWGEVMTRPVNGGEVKVVHATLRFGETITDIRGYPGGIGRTVSVLKVDADPDSFEVLSETFGRKDSPTTWARFAHRAITAYGSSVAWLSPLDYVITKQPSDTESRLVFERFIVGCESPNGLLLAYDGDEIDNGRSQIAWNVVPIPGRELLVMSRSSVAEAAENPVDVNWSALSIETGELRDTSIRWSEGPWTSVWPDAPPLGASDCKPYHDHPDRVRAI